MDISYQGGIRECLSDDFDLNAFTFIFLLGTEWVTVRPETSECCLGFTLDRTDKMEQLLHIVTITVKSLLLELNEQVGLADLALGCYARSDEENILIEEFYYTNIPVKIYQHRAILSTNIRPDLSIITD